MFIGRWSRVAFIGNGHFKGGIKKSLSGTVLVTVALIINGGFSYLLQLFLGRLFTVEDYGTFNALLSLFYIFGIPAGALALSIVKIVSDLFGERKMTELANLFWGLSKRALIGGLVIVGALLVVRKPFAAYLNIEDPILIFFLGLYVLGTFIALPPPSYLRGMLLFNKFALFTIASGFLRLIIPLGIVSAGYKVGGVFVGLFLSLVFSYFVGVALFNKYLKDKGSIELSSIYKKITSFSGPILLLNLGLLSLINVDMVLVKRYFSGVEAGYYAGVITLGKIILFGAGAVAMVMFPEVSALRAAKKDYMKRFKFFTLLQLAVLLPAILAFTIFPKFITVLFFGERFINSVEYLPMFAVFISIYVLSNFLIRFFLAVEKTKVYLLLIVPMVFQFIAINLYHNSLNQVILINIVSSATLLVSLGFYLYKVNYDRINNRTSVQSS